MANVLQGLDPIQMLQKAQQPSSPQNRALLPEHLMRWAYHTVVWSGQGQGTYN